MRRALVAIALTLAAAGSPAHAQGSTSASQAVEIVARGLEAQHRAAVIRERRLADERQTRLMAEAEDRMRAARRRLVAAESDRAAAQLELEASRAAFAELVSSIPLQTAAARIEAEVFRAEVTGALAQATPELTAAYQAFADGDRTAAWTTLNVLLQARANARLAAARTAAGAEMRQLASLREIMRANGEATIADVLALWSQAAELDPSDVWAHLYRARLSRRLGDPETARAALRAAANHVQYDRDRSIVASEAADLLYEEGNFTEALRLYEVAIEVTRRLNADYPNEAVGYVDLAFTLNRIADARRRLGDFDGAQAAYEEALSLRRRLAQLNPGVVIAQRDLSYSLNKVAEIRFRRNDQDAALGLYRESEAILRRLSATEPNNLTHAQDLAYVLRQLGFVHRFRIYDHPEEIDDARRCYEESVTFARRIAASDAADTAAQVDLADALEGLASLQTHQREFDAAQRNQQEVIDIYRRMLALNPRNSSAREQLAGALTLMAHVQIGLNDLAAARSSAEESVQLMRDLPSAAASFRSSLATNLNTLGNVLSAQRNFDSARAAHEEALSIQRALQAENPTNPTYTAAINGTLAFLNIVASRANAARQNARP